MLLIMVISLGRLRTCIGEDSFRQVIIYICGRADVSLGLHITDRNGDENKLAANRLSNSQCRLIPNCNRKKSGKNLKMR